MNRISSLWGRRRQPSAIAGESEGVQYRYDSEADALSIVLIPERSSAKTVQLDECRLVDLDNRGRVVALEVLWASEGFKLHDIIEQFELWEYGRGLEDIESMHFTPAVAL